MSFILELKYAFTVGGVIPHSVRSTGLPNLLHRRLFSN